MRPLEVIRPLTGTWAFRYAPNSMFRDTLNVYLLSCFYIKLVGPPARHCPTTFIGTIDAKVVVIVTVM